MWALLFAGFAAGGCEGPTGNQLQRYRVTSAIACVRVENCFFGSVHTAADGGAVYVGSSSCSVEILSTTFLSCHTDVATECYEDCGFFFCDEECYDYYPDGGACYLDCARISVDRCCGRLCRGWDGQFLLSDCRQSPNSVNYSSLFECAPSSSGDSTDIGGIFIADALSYSFSLLNFTSCYSNYCGSALYFYASSGSAVCSSLTCFASLGHSAVGNRRYNPIPTIDLSNFLNNSALSRSVLYGPYDGMSVVNCIFLFNVQECYIGQSLDSHLFSIVNCYFSGAVPSGWFISASGNTENVVVLSHLIWHLNTGQCPGAIPFSHAWAQSRRFDPTIHGAFMPTSKPLLSQPLFGSVIPVATHAFTATDALLWSEFGQFFSAGYTVSCEIANSARPSTSRRLEITLPFPLSPVVHQTIAWIASARLHGSSAAHPPLGLDRSAIRGSALIWKSPELHLSSQANSTDLFLRSPEWRPSIPPFDFISHPLKPSRLVATPWRNQFTSIFNSSNPSVAVGSVEESPLIATSDRMLTTAPILHDEFERSWSTTAAMPAEGWSISSPVLIGVIAGVAILALVIAAFIFVAHWRLRHKSTYSGSGNPTEAATESVHSLAQPFDCLTVVNILTITDLSVGGTLFDFDANEASLL
jgi:hypothetical protein